MKENEMKEIATFMKQVIIEKKDPKKILSKVKSWRKDYQKSQILF
jgi:serine hydroxymethyltransferase (EC 2.1.2.1)